MSVSYIAGDDLQFKVLVKLGNECYDLSNVTAATLKIPNNSGGTIDLTLGSGLSIPSGPNGIVVVDLDDVQGAAIKIGTIDIELILDESSKFKTLQFKNAIKSSARLY